MPKFAAELREVYPVSYEHTDEDGLRWLHLKVDAPFDWEQVKKLPAALAYGGEVFIRTGWNSDKGEAYYRNNMPGARTVVDALRNTHALLDTPVGRRKFSSQFECDVRASVNAALSALEEK